MIDRTPIAEQTVQRLLASAAKPARYTGGEVHSVVEPGPVRCRLALCFPDVYEVAESHIGLKILYDIVNRADGFAAERCYAFWPDLEERARAAGVPIWSLETYRPLGAFDLVGFTLQYELTYATMLAMLDHGGITLRAVERAPEEPFVIAGGAGAYNPEPIADFMDAVLVGDGEVVILDILEAVAAGRERGASRAAILHDLGALPGVYVPSHYELTYDGLRVTGIRALPGTPKAEVVSRHGTPRITRALVPDIDRAPYPSTFIIPNASPVHERATVEIQRGCTRSCRFCQAGMTNRPTRQRSPGRVLGLVDRLLASTGCDEVGLLSLSAGDYGPLDELLVEFFRSHDGDQVNVALPSLRTETMTAELAEQIATVRKSGFTLAPEAGSERLRAVINKTSSDEDLLNAVRSATQAGWRLLKLYFMIGLPTETEADIDAIVDLTVRARAAGRRERSDLKLTVSVSTFVPKPHTPFQWAAQLDAEGARAVQEHLRDELRARKITLRYHAVEQSFLEGVLCRGDRRLAPAIEAAMRAGCRFDAWTERHDPLAWQRALADALAPHGLTAADYLGERSEDHGLPWDHLDTGVLKKFLRRDLARARAGEMIEDCASTDRCYACGGCDIADPYGDRRERSREGALVRPRLFEAGDLEPTPAGARPPPLTSNQEERSRLRFRFAKRGRALHLSHLGSKDIILRAVRLAGMPVVYSQGYTPRPKIGFSPACPTGIVSEAEFFEVICHGLDVAAEPWIEQVGRFLPAGLSILEAEAVELKGRPVDDLIATMSYVVARPATVSPADLTSAVETFGARQSWWVRVVRKRVSRVLDARAQIIDVEVIEDALRFTIVMAEHGTLKVREAVGAVLGVEHANDLDIRKTGVRIAKEGEERINVEPVIGDDAREVVDLSRLGEHPSRSFLSRVARPAHAH